MKQNLKKLLAGCLALLLHTSCAVISTPVSGFNEQMAVLKEHYPELYDLHSQGKIVIWGMWQKEKRGDETGKKSYSIEYIQNNIHKSYPD